MATLQDLEKYGLKLFRQGNRTFLSERGASNLSSGVREILDPQNLGIDSNQIEDVTQNPDFIAGERKAGYNPYFQKAGINIQTAKENINSAGLQNIIGQYQQAQTLAQQNQQIDQQTAAKNALVAQQPTTPDGTGAARLNQQLASQGLPPLQQANQPTPQQPQQVSQPSATAGTQPVSTYTGPSIVDYLKSVNQPTDFASRSRLAQQMGIQNYTGTAQQNTQLLNTLRTQGQGQTPAQPGTPATGQNNATTGGQAGQAVVTDTPSSTIPDESSTWASLGLPANLTETNITDIVTKISDAFGLPDIKKEMTDLDAKLAEEIQEANENPWLSEGARAKKVSAIQTKYETKRQSVVDRLKTQSDIVGKALDVFDKEREYKKDLLFKSLDLKAKALDESKKTTDDIREYEFAKEQGYAGTFVDYQKTKAATTTPSSFREWQLAGEPGTYEEWLRTTGRPPTQAQETVATYAARLEQSNPTITSLGDTVTKMNPLSFEAQIRLPAFLQSPDIQQYMQAARNFINATLRRESGAVIAESEFANAYNQYLPKPGDTAQTLANKKKNRDIVQASFKKGAGPAYQSVDELLGIQNNDPLGIR